MSDSTYKLIQNSSTGTTTDIQLCNYTVNGSTGSMANITSAINYTDNDLICKAPTIPLNRGIAYIRDNLSPNCIAGYTANNKYCVKTDYDYLKNVKNNISISRNQ